MDEINRLDDKYLVVKFDDIKDLDDLRIEQLKDIIHALKSIRKAKGKAQTLPSYVVLNLDDEIDLSYLKLVWLGMRKLKVKDIAIDLVNAILHCKGSEIQQTDEILSIIKSMPGIWQKDIEKHTELNHSVVSRQCRQLRTNKKAERECDPKERSWRWVPI